MSLPKIFISYKRNHPSSETLVKRIEKELAGEFEFLRDVEIQASKRWTYELYDWLLGCDGAIIVVSKAANSADWCRREWSILTARWEVAKLPVIRLCVEETYFETGILDEIQGAKGVLDSHQLIELINTTFTDLEASSFTPKDFLAAHFAWLNWQYREAPVFQKEPYALGDVYIEPECGVLSQQVIDENKLDPFLEKPKNGGRHPMLEYILDLLGDPDFKDLIVIQGGPGAGKSAFTLRLANALLAEQLQPVLVRFRDLRLSQYSNAGELLDDAIRIGYADEDSPHPKFEIISELLEERVPFGKASICKTVIILDGWDEVSLTGNEFFKAQLSTWLPRLREYFTDKRGTKVRMILTGRPSNEVSHSGILRKGTPILTMRPMRPDQLESYASDISDRLNAASDDHSNDEYQAPVWNMETDRLHPIFVQYRGWFYRDSKQTRDSAADFLGNPLLAYLAFRVFAETEQSLHDLIKQPTALYHELMNITVSYAGKGKGQDEGLEGTVHRGGEQLRRLLQEVAATISILRSESVSYRELEARFEDSELPIDRQLLRNWQDNADTATALQELVINFYFKGGSTDLGCEFLHKSFREYLFAEAIFHTLLDEDATASGLFKSDKAYSYWEDFVHGSPEYRLSRRLSYLLAPQWLSDEVRTHLFWLIDRDIAKDTEKWRWIRSALLGVYAWWAEGVLLRHQRTRSRVGARWDPPFVDSLFQQVIPFDDEKARFKPIRTSILDSHLGEALMQLTAWVIYQLHDVAGLETMTDERSADYYNKSDKQILFKPGGGGFFYALVARFDTEGWRESSGIIGMQLPAIDIGKENFSFANAATAFLKRANLIGANLTGANLIEADLSGADLSGADLSGTGLRGTNLRGANLSGANLSKANLFEADLCGAHLTGANLIEADLYGADLSGANLIEADLRGANLSGANLSGASLFKANLRGANLSRANLFEADLRGTNLRGANLSGANLSKANLFEADLCGANLSRANLFEADLSGANLSGADLRVTNLRGANLSGANLSGASLFKANLRGANLSGANLFEADLFEADLSRVNLSRARNLEYSKRRDKAIGYKPPLIGNPKK